MVTINSIIRLSSEGKPEICISRLFKAKEFGGISKVKKGIDYFYTMDVSD